MATLDGDRRPAFEAAHRQRFGFVMPDKPLVVEAVAVEAVGATDAADDPVCAAPRDPRPRRRRWRRSTIFTGGAEHRGAGLRPRRAAARRTRSTGRRSSARRPRPPWSSPAGARGSTRRRYLVLERVGAAAATAPRSAPTVDPVMLEVFNNLFMAIAEQMGVALQNTAYSVNIKERLDFSCALFDRDGALIANAPHMPVHLGSMGESVQTVIRARGDGADGRGMRPGDVYVLNAPYNGGTHLPDITVIMPVFAEDAAERRRCCSTSPRAAITPISAASRRARCRPTARSVEEEGVLIDDFLLVDAGRFREAETRRAAASRPLSGAQPGAEHRRSQGAGRRLRQGRRRSCTAWCGISAGRWSRPICATCRTMPRKRCAA